MKTRSDIQSKIHLFLLAVVAAALLAPTAALAQPNWLQYQLKVTATGYTGDPNFFSGLVQGANLLTTSISIPEGPADAYANPSISYGWLQLNAGCSVNNTSPDGNGYGAGFDSAVGGGEDVMFQDTLTITTSTLPMGTPVQVQIACVYNGSITPGTGYGNDTTTSSASVGLAWSIPGNNNSVSGPVGGVNQTNTISFVANVAVGNNNYEASSLTALPAIGTSNTGGRGEVLGGQLESSTVDIATEFTNLIVYQRGYEANAKVVNTADTLSQDTINLIQG